MPGEEDQDRGQRERRPRTADALEGLVSTWRPCSEVAGDKDRKSMKGHITKHLRYRVKKFELYFEYCEEIVSLRLTYAFLIIEVICIH